MCRGLRVSTPTLPLPAPPVTGLAAWLLGCRPNRRPRRRACGPRPDSRPTAPVVPLRGPVTGPHRHPVRRSLTGPQHQNPNRRPERFRQRFPEYRTALSYPPAMTHERRIPTHAAPFSTTPSGGILTPNTGCIPPLPPDATEGPREAQRRETEFRHTGKGPTALAAGTAPAISDRPGNPARRHRGNHQNDDTKPNTGPGRREGRARDGRTGRAPQAGRERPKRRHQSPAAGRPDQAQRDGLAADQDSVSAQQRSAAPGGAGGQRGAAEAGGPDGGRCNAAVQHAHPPPLPAT